MYVGEVLDRYIALVFIFLSFAASSDADEYRRVEGRSYSSESSSYHQVNGNFYGTDGSKVTKRAGFTVYTPGDRIRFQGEDSDPVPNYSFRICQTIGQDTFCR